MTIHLVQILPKSRMLAPYARRAGLPSDDPGYLWHRALRDAFGSSAPQPFRWFESDGKPCKILGYSPADASSLRQALTLAEPDLAEIFPEDAMQSRPMPTAFEEGQKLRFEVRICPVVRTPSQDGERMRELDAFVHYASARPEERGLRREPIYRDWLARRFETVGAAIDHAEMTGFALAPLVRRRHASPSGRTATREGAAKRLLAGGQRKAARRPEAVFRGALSVCKADAFAAGLEKGVGRHRAFGFGMLLLRPV